MNDSYEHIQDEESETAPQDNSRKIPAQDSASIKSDGAFNIKISEDMTIRNILRSGLVEAQGRNTDKIPMFVSWPNWLNDGIVCLFAKDLHTILHKSIKKTALSLFKSFGVEDMDVKDDTFIEEQLQEQAPLSVIENEMVQEKAEEIEDADSTEDKQQAEMETELKAEPEAGDKTEFDEEETEKNDT